MITKCVPILLIKLKPRKKVSNIKSVERSKLNILSLLSAIKNTSPIRFRRIPNDVMIVIP